MKPRWQVVEHKWNGNEYAKSIIGKPMAKLAAQERADKLNDIEVNKEAESVGFLVTTPLTSYMVQEA